MAITKLENTLKIWREEILVSPDKTTLKPKHIERLERAIDKWYAMQSKAQSHIDKIEKWANEL